MTGPLSRRGSATVRWLPPLLVVAVTFAAFLPTLENGFVNWDDFQIFVDNPHYRGLGWAQLRWMFMTSLMGHYSPVTWITLGADYLLWGMNPAGYHLTSLLLHIATALVFYLVTLRLLRLAVPEPGEAGPRLAAGFAALLFAIHPLRVEPVAWVSGRYDVLASLFFLLALLAYLRACGVDDRARRRWLAASVGAFALTLMSKASGAALPVVLVALDAYPLRRLRPPARGVWAEKIPFLLLAVGGALLALVGREQEMQLIPLEKHGIMGRLAQAAFGLAFYLWKTVVPVGLSPLYPLVLPLNPLAAPFVLSGGVVLVITLGLLVGWRRFPAGLVVWVCYAATLLPVLGFTQRGPQLVADRYSYLPCLGWAVLAGAGVLAAWRARESGRVGRSLLTLTIALAVLTVAVLGSLTWRQVGVWHDSIRLWTHVLNASPNSYVGHYNLGNALYREGRLSEAIAEYQRTLSLNPAHAKAHINLGHIYHKKGLIDAAMAEYQQVIALDPNNAVAHNNLAVAYYEQGLYRLAIHHHDRAKELGLSPNPQFSEVLVPYR